MKTKVKELLEAIAQKDLNALGLLYEEVARQVFNYIRSITLCKETAEDVLHDVFMQIYDNAARISRADEPMAYIMRIARNRAYNIWKGEKRTLTGIEADGVSEDTASHIIAKLEFEEAYDALPQKQRETIYLHLYCGFSHDEVAAIQGVPAVTAKWRYRKALSKLKESLSEGEFIIYETSRVDHP